MTLEGQVLAKLELAKQSQLDVAADLSIQMRRIKLRADARCMFAIGLPKISMSYCAFSIEHLDIDELFREVFEINN